MVRRKPSYTPCANCGSLTRSKTGICQKNTDCKRLSIASWGAQYRGPRLKCLNCGYPKAQRKNYSILSYCSRTLDCRRLRSQELKKLCIDAYGGSCVCCDEQRLYFLTIDH